MGEVVRVAVDGRGGGEDDVLHAGLHHGVEQGERAGDVVGEVAGGSRMDSPTAMKAAKWMTASHCFVSHKAGERGGVGEVQLMQTLRGHVVAMALWRGCRQR